MIGRRPRTLAAAAGTSFSDALTLSLSRERERGPSGRGRATRVPSPWKGGRVGEGVDGTSFAKRTPAFQVRSGKLTGMFASSGVGTVSCQAGSSMTRSDSASRPGNVPAGKRSG